MMTKSGKPVEMGEVADVRDTTEDRRSFQRINGKPGVRMQVTKQSGKNTVAIAQGVKQAIETTNLEVPSVRLTLLNDQSKFIERSINSVREHVYIGAFLVIGIIFLFPVSYTHLTLPTSDLV